MSLTIQIQSLIFSFVYGLFFATIFRLFSKYFNTQIKYINIIIIFSFVLFNALLYFFCLSIVNNGIVHFYFLLTVLLGFLIENKVNDYLKKYKKWYNIIGDTMKKKKIKHKTTRRILTLDLCCAIFCSFILLTFTSYWVDIVNLYNEKKDLETNLTTLKEEEKNLKNDVKKLNDPDYVARYARERFFYSKNQEYIIRIP